MRYRAHILSPPSIHICKLVSSFASTCSTADHYALVISFKDGIHEPPSDLPIKKKNLKGPLADQATKPRVEEEKNLRLPLICPAFSVMTKRYANTSILHRFGKYTTM